MFYFVVTVVRATGGPNVLGGGVAVTGVGGSISRAGVGVVTPLSRIDGTVELCSGVSGVLISTVTS